MRRPSSLRLGACLASALLVPLTTPLQTRACTTCGTGSGALIPAGQGLPYSGRARLFAELQGRGERVDETGRNQRTLEELQLTLGVAYAPTDRLWLSAQLPILLSRGRWENLDRYTTVGPGDLELQARYLLFRDRAFSPHHLFGISGGVQLPTAPVHHSAQGTILPLAVQSGTASLDGSAGAFYVFLAEPWSFFANLNVRAPVWSRHAELPGPTVEAQLTGQLQLNENWSLRVGVVAFGRGPQRENGRRDRNGEVFALYGTPALLWAPSADWLLLIGARIPVMTQSRQEIEETPVGLMSVVIDV